MTSRLIYDVIFYTVFVTVLIPIGILGKQFKHQPPEMRWLMLTLILSFTGDFISELLSHFPVVSVNSGGTFYAIVAPMSFAYFFANSLEWPHRRQIILLIGLAVTAFALYNFLFLQKQQMNSYSLTLLSLYILAMSIVYFYKLLRELPTTRLHQLPLFWIISSFFFAHAGKLVLNIVSHYMTTIMKDNLLVLWIMHNILTFIGLMVLSWGVWLQLRILTDKQSISKEVSGSKNLLIRESGDQ